MLGGAPSSSGWMDSLQICSVATKTLNMQSRTNDKEWSSRLQVGRRATNS
jgi:hypothetical protein